MSRRLERDLLAAGERLLRVSPKLMAHARDSARTYGKSNPIDALAVARAALREPNLLTAQLDGPDRELRLLAGHRDDLVQERTRVINKIRWHVHEIDPTWQPPARCLQRTKHLTKLATNLEPLEGVVPRLCRALVQRCRELTNEISALDKEIADLVEKLAPSLLAITGCGNLTAAKIAGETAGVRRFKSRHVYARHNGTAPLPVWTGNRQRHRLSRTGNRQLNAALHRIAITQARYHQPARDFLKRRRASGNSTTEPLRALKRRLSDVVYHALLADA